MTLQSGLCRENPLTQKISQELAKPNDTEKYTTR